MADHLKTLEDFVPRLIREWFLQDEGAPAAPEERTFPGCVLIADVSGFTPLVEQLSADRERGAEAVQRALNGLFGPLAERIEDWGGEVLCFPGDAALALWTAPSVEALGDSIRRAARCAVEAQRSFESANAERGLRLRVGVGAGQVRAASVGGVGGRWSLLVQGDPLRQLGEALACAAPGEVALSEQSTRLVADGIEGHARGDCLVVDSVAPVEAPRAADEPAVGEEALRAFVPRAVQARIAAGQRDWMAEFRRVTVAFLGLEDFDVETRGLDLVQRVVCATQEIAYRYEGSLNQIVHDEKGTVLVLVWGSALHAHEDDPVRAVRAVLQMRKEIEALGVASRAGIATDRVFTGRRGSSRRAEFGLIGSGVNRAARLLQAADGIACDAPTRSAARRQLAFAARPRVRAKGLGRDIAAYEPLGERARDEQLVGRERERKVIEGALLALEEGGKGGVVYIEGNAGIGKSRLVAHLLERARQTPVRVMTSHADAIDRNASYHVWKTVLLSLVGAEPTPERVARLLGSPEEVGNAALLNPLLPGSLFPDSAAVESLSAQGRAQAVRDLMSGMLARAANERPLMLVVEDVHWMDSASWQLLEAVCERVPGMLVLLTARPEAGGTRGEVSRILSHETAQQLELDVMQPHESLALAAQRLQVDELPDSVASLVLSRAEGNPFFTEELVYSLRDSGLLRIEDGECVLDGESRDLELLAVPDTIQGVVTTRIDRLSVEQQLTLKVASVIGRRFALEDLRLVHPIPGDRDAIPEQIETMTRLRLLRDDGGGAYSFQHAITRDTCYAMLPPSQRRDLHRRTAEHLEKRFEDESSAYPTLAHHWQRADVRDRAIEYLAKAGEQALLRDYANREAAHFFEELLASDRAGHASDDLSRARWERQLSEALFNLGRHAEGVPHAELALGLLGERLPRVRSATVLRVAAGIVARLLRRRVGYRQTPLPDRDRRRFVEAERAYERLSTASYTTGDTVVGIHAALRAMKLGERVGPSPELARLYGNFSNVMQLVGSNRMADAYSDHALRVARESDDLAAQAHALCRANLHRTVRGQWSACDGLRTSIALSDQIGNDYQWEESSAMLAYCRLIRGDAEGSLEHFDDVLARARRSGAIIHQLWALAAQGDACLRLGRIDQAIECAQDTLDLLETSRSLDQVTRFQARGILASAWRRKQGRERSAPWAARAVEAMTAPARLGYGAQSGFEGILEHHLAHESPSRDDLREGSRTLRLLRFTSRTRTIFRPAALRWDGVRTWHLGSEERALSKLRQSISIADSLALPFDRARAELELAARLPTGAAERETLVARAEQTLAELGATWELRRLRSLVTS